MTPALRLLRWPSGLPPSGLAKTRCSRPSARTNTERSQERCARSARLFAPRPCARSGRRPGRPRSCRTQFSGALQQRVVLASFAVGGFQLEGYAMTLSAFAWNIVRTYTLTPGRRYSFGCRYRLGTASNLVMCVSAADNDYVGVTGTFLGTASQGVWSTARLDFSVPPGGIAKLHFVYPRAGAAVGGHFLHFFAMRHCLAAASGPGRSVSLTLKW